MMHRPLADDLVYCACYNAAGTIDGATHAFLPNTIIYYFYSYMKIG